MTFWWPIMAATAVVVAALGKACQPWPHLSPKMPKTSSKMPKKTTATIHGSINDNFDCIMMIRATANASCQKNWGAGHVPSFLRPVSRAFTYRGSVSIVGILQWSFLMRLCVHGHWRLPPSLNLVIQRIGETWQSPQQVWLSLVTSRDVMCC